MEGNIEQKINCIPENMITHWMRLIYRNTNNIHNSKLNEFALTTSQVCVLSRLWIQNGITQKEIAQNIEIRPASLTALINTLVAKGWAERREDSRDARINRIYLTDKGDSLKFKCININDEMENLLTKGFSKEEKQLMLCWLKKMYVNMQ